VADGFAVQTRALRKAYRAGDQELQVLRGIDLDIRRGEFVSIMGPSGSGKSTLLNLVGLLDVPTAGAIRLLGTETQHMSSNERARMRRQSLGFVFQSFNLLPRLDALHNVLLPMAIAGVPRRTRTEKARALLESVGLGDRATHLPSELSGGQKQRVALARALALDPPILLADEPTGNLDSGTSAEVMQLFAHLHAQGRTVIQVTHDEDMAKFGTRTVRILDGLVERQEHRPMVLFEEPSFFLAPPRPRRPGATKAQAQADEAAPASAPRRAPDRPAATAERRPKPPGGA
jgi:putative ABC transport system ATP-binding protein